jgi:hypothetical protein
VVGVDDGADDLGGLANLGTRGLGVAQEQCVNYTARDAVTMVGHTGPAREGQFPLARAEYGGPVEPVEFGDLVGETNFLKEADGPGS